jgi:hypothetical protein
LTRTEPSAARVGFDERDANLEVRFERAAIDRSTDRRAPIRPNGIARRATGRLGTGRTREDGVGRRARIAREREAAARTRGGGVERIGLDLDFCVGSASSDRRGGDTSDRELGSARVGARDRSIRARTWTRRASGRAGTKVRRRRRRRFASRRDASRART